MLFAGSVQSCCVEDGVWRSSLVIHYGGGEGPSKARSLKKMIPDVILLLEGELSPCQFYPSSSLQS